VRRLVAAFDLVSAPLWFTRYFFFITALSKSKAATSRRTPNCSGARNAMAEMTPQGSAKDFFPEKKTLSAFRKAAADCKACDLWECGTQTVFGEGSSGADLLLVGEQPGNEEDLIGRPFVGPAGRLLDEALAEAGIDRSRIYVTNVVKHFKWVARGKRRIHEKPNARERAACRPWLDAEIALVKPRVVVCLGATAVQTLLGPSFRVTKDRGRPIESTVAPYIVATIHPSAILRTPDEETRHREKRLFIDDLLLAAQLLSKTK
jgi:uracil-DNA glycosylase